MDAKLINDEIVAVLTAAVAACVRGTFHINNIRKVKSDCTRAWRHRARSVGTTRKSRRGITTI